MRVLGVGKIARVVWSLDPCSFIRIRGVIYPTPTWYRNTKPKRGKRKR